MKINVLIFMLINCVLIYSQNNPIDQMKVVPENIEYKGCVKNIKIKSLYLGVSKDLKDTTKAISIVDFSRKGLIQQIKSYYSPYGDSWKTTVFDNFERVRSISKKQESTTTSIVNQYFSNNYMFPDSTIIIGNEKYIEKYINIFKKNQLIRQNHYVNDSLKDYRTYLYNKNNQLIEDTYFNSDNPEGESMVSTKINNLPQLSFYPDQKKFYDYNTINDTNIVTIKKPKSLRKEIIKKVKNKKYSLEIIEKYDNNQLDDFTSVLVSEGLTSKIHKRYTKNKAINNYYNTITTDTSHVAKYSTYENEPESTYKIDISTIYDKFNNWIKKTYSRNKIVDTIIERKIEYYCH